MTLEATFSLTPRSSYFRAPDNQFYANLSAYGAVFCPNFFETYRNSFDHQHTADELYFELWHAADPALDYRLAQNLKIAPHIRLIYDLSSLGNNKELALVFGFDAWSESRVLIYTNAGLLGDVSLIPGDNQFLIEIESLSYLALYFIDCCLNGQNSGGRWYFKGINGYVV
ncbi:MAG: hypothetical protein ACFFDT_24925 [Candidatus Hodarchaeota archaeon]